MESLRYLPYLKKEGWLVTNSRPFVNIPNYPEIEKVNAELDKLPHKVVLDVEEIAKEAGSVRAANIVMLGAATPFIGDSSMIRSRRESVRYSVVRARI